MEIPQAAPNRMREENYPKGVTVIYILVAWRMAHDVAITELFLMHASFSREFSVITSSRGNIIAVS